MKEYDIAQALTDVSDEFLLEAETAGTRKKPMKFRRIAAVAAIVSMLAMTAGAVGITWRTERVEIGRERLWMDYYRDEGELLEFDKLIYQVPLERTELDEGAQARLTELLAREWDTWVERGLSAAGRDTVLVYDSWGMESPGPEPGEEPVFPGIEEVEELLGISLRVSPELRRYIRMGSAGSGAEGIRLLVESDLTMLQAAEGGAIQPARVEVSFKLPSYYCGNGDVTGTIVLALTEETAKEGLEIVWYSYEKEGDIWQEDAAFGTQDVMFFGNDPEEGYEGFCQAVYTDGGIAYTLNAEKSRLDPEKLFPKPTYETAKEMLLPLLEELE